jgi:hypothetical protein
MYCLSRIGCRSLFSPPVIIRTPTRYRRMCDSWDYIIPNYCVTDMDTTKMEQHDKLSSVGCIGNIVLCHSINDEPVVLDGFDYTLWVWSDMNRSAGWIYDEGTTQQWIQKGRHSNGAKVYQKARPTVQSWIQQQQHCLEQLYVGASQINSWLHTRIMSATYDMVRGKQDHQPCLTLLFKNNAALFLSADEQNCSSGCVELVKTIQPL